MTPNPYTVSTAITEEQLAEEMRLEEEALAWMFRVEMIARWIISALVLLPLTGMLWHKIKGR